MRRDLSVWVVQKGKEELNEVLSKVNKGSLGNILYLNCWCKLDIGGKIIKGRIFDSCLYSEDSDMLVLFAKGTVSEDDIVKHLDKYEIKYTAIRFEEKNSEGYKNLDSFPDIYIARGKSSLMNAINDSFNKNMRSCVYYPTVQSFLSLSYRDVNDEIYDIESRICQGLLVFEDKLILLVNQNDKFNIKDKAIVENLLIKNGIEYRVGKNYNNSDKRR